MTSHPSESTIMLQLTAYLDGELGSTETQEVEERLATDETYRNLLQSLQKTWDVLDILPASQANATFTQSTMKLVVEDAKNLGKKKSHQFWTWPVRILALILVPAAASAGAYLASHYMQSQPNRELERDLEQIRDFDVYSKDKNVTIEFLEMLAANPSIFGVTINDEMKEEERFQTYLSPPSTLVEIQTLSDNEKGRIRINRANFNRAHDDDKTRVKQLITQINSHKHADQLKHAMFQYCFWLKRVPESEEAELLDLKTSEERIAKIKKIVESQIFDNFELQLPQKDFAQIKLMLMYTINLRKDQIRDVFKKNLDFERYIEVEILTNKKENLSTTDRTIFSNGLLLKDIYNKRPDQIKEILLPDDVLRIKGFLTEEAKAAIDWALRNNVDQSEEGLLTSWLLAAYDAMFHPVTPKNLMDVFNELPPEQQDELNNEYPADREKILREIYSQSS